MELKCLVLQSQRRTLYLFESPIEAATPRQVFARPISRFPFTNLPKLFFFFFFVPPTRYDISKDKNPKSSFSLLLRCIIYIYSLVLYTKWIHVHVTFLFVGGSLIKSDGRNVCIDIAAIGQPILFLTVTFLYGLATAMGVAP